MIFHHLYNNPFKNTVMFTRLFQKHGTSSVLEQQPLIVSEFSGSGMGWEAVMNVCNFSSWAGRWEIQGHPLLHSEFLDSQGYIRPYLRNQKVKLKQTTTTKGLCCCCFNFAVWGLELGCQWWHPFSSSSWQPQRSSQPSLSSPYVQVCVQLSPCL